MMKKQPRDFLGSLAELIRTNRRSADGFHAAAGLVRDPSLATLLRDVGHQRRLFVEELRAIEWIDDESLTESVTDGAESAAIPHAGHAMSAGERTVLAEVERQEEVILRLYEGALSRIAGEAVYDLLIRQYLAVKETHGRIRQFHRGSTG